MKKPKAKAKPRFRFTEKQSDGSRKINKGWLNKVLWSQEGSIELEFDPVSLVVTKIRVRLPFEA